MTEAYFPEKTAANNLAGAMAWLRAENSYAVPNRFEVIITSPSKVASLRDQRKVSLRCETINLPGRNLNTITDAMPYGTTREVVDGVTYAEDITMTFAASCGLEERVFFEKWQELAFNKETWNVGYYDDYVKTIDIYLMDRQDKRRYGVKLYEAFPTTIGAIDLSYSSNNEIIRTPVTFSFRYWETADTNRQSGSLIDNIFETVVDSVGREISRNIPKVLRNL